ncbi:PREDICTED: uncharacterized protein LOC104589871 [Nelumbo nucifera]|uniref:Uncharacterized protein LOC104589871 n=1 Tax=Nelumbo nucifera TaxID=4432 RepID=A0A1U7ZGE7_NELNU|nr:PREDICTED: uncharacterized protein LOC104589871 [Nelumbo nucifera]
MVLWAPTSISSWKQFASLFLAHFVNSRRCQKSVVSLMPVRHKRIESLRSYIDRFKKEELKIRDLDPMVSMHIAINDLLPGLALKYSVVKTPPKTKAEFLEKAQKYFAAEGVSVGKHHEGESDHNRGGSEKKGKNGDGHDNKNNNNSKDGNKKLLVLTYNKYTPLNSTPTQILMQVGKEECMKWPKKMKRNPKRGNPKKYCKYHRDTGHDTEDCYDLKNEIEPLIRHGHLKEYMMGDVSASSQ